MPKMNLDAPIMSPHDVAYGATLLTLAALIAGAASNGGDYALEGRAIDALSMCWQPATTPRRWLNAAGRKLRVETIGLLPDK